MKRQYRKLTTTLLIISVITIAFMVFMEFVWNDGSRRSSFITKWLVCILAPLIFPLVGKSISIAFVRTKPFIWLIVHGTATLVWIVVQSFAFSLIENTMDLSLCINRQYSMTTTTVQTVSADKNKQIIRTGIGDFRLENTDFHNATRDGAYRITYLPNSKYVIDVVDEDTGYSLLRRR